MSSFYLPIPSAFGQNVQPNAGAKLFFFDVGTSTPKTTFSDAGETTPHTDPVVADARGRFPQIYLSGAYKVELQDANDVQVWVVDNIPGGTGTIGDVIFLGNFDSSTNSGDYPATGSKGNMFVVTTGFTLNPTSGSHVLSTRDFIIANTDGAAGVDADWDIIRGVNTAIDSDVVVTPWITTRTYAIGDYVKATDNKQYRALVSQSGNDPAGGSDPTNWLPFGDLVDDLVTDDPTRGGTVANDFDLKALIDNPAIASQSTRGINYVRVVGDILPGSSDPDHDISFLDRTIVFSDGTGNASLPVLIKQLDSIWAPGTDNGGRAVSVALTADTTYHCFALSNAEGTLTDYGFDTSVSASNLLTDAAAISFFGAAFKWVRIWSIVTDGSSNILGFRKYGKKCVLDARIPDILNPFGGGTTATLVFSSPTGIPMEIVITIQLVDSAFNNLRIDAINQDNPAVTDQNSDLSCSDDSTPAQSEITVKTNQNASVRGRLEVANPSFMTATLKAWIDYRLTEEN